MRFLIACAVGVSCGSPSPPLFTGNGDEGGGASAGKDDGTTGGLASYVGGGEPACSTAATLVYVLSEENDLYSFDPGQKIFTKIGALDCVAPGLTPNSMAVARDGTAWVNYTSDDDATGAIFEVSTADAHCKPTRVSLERGWTRLGMGFSTDTAGGIRETLYVAGTGDRVGLGRLDLSTQILSPIGPFGGTLAGRDAELTGAGDGTLFGFFTTSPVRVARIEKSSGATSGVVPMTGLEWPRAWAFSYWGGELYLYTWPGAASRTTNVTHYVPSTGAIDTVYMTDIGFVVVGAGVSTCAPTSPPAH